MVLLDSLLDCLGVPGGVAALGEADILGEAPCPCLGDADCLGDLPTGVTRLDGDSVPWVAVGLNVGLTPALGGDTVATVGVAVECAADGVGAPVGVCCCQTGAPLVRIGCGRDLSGDGAETEGWDGEEIADGACERNGDEDALDLSGDCECGDCCSPYSKFLLDETGTPTICSSLSTISLLSGTSLNSALFKNAVLRLSIFWPRRFFKKMFMTTRPFV